jgi:non-ribosomal peptide synthetase component F
VGLQRLGIRPGDRVAAYLPNIPETLVAFAATASIGAVWASCAPELGARSVIDRFAQLDPAVLLAIGSYGFRDRMIDRRDEVAAIRAGLPSLRHVIEVPYGPHQLPASLSWDELTAEPAALAFEPVAFEHPLYVLFSSGTTRRPKAIVHSHGGILLEHLKSHALSWDLKPDGRLLWFTTTTWIDARVSSAAAARVIIRCLILAKALVRLRRRRAGSGRLLRRRCGRALRGRPKRKSGHQRDAWFPRGARARPLAARQRQGSAPPACRVEGVTRGRLLTRSSSQQPNPDRTCPRVSTIFHGRRS